MARTTGRPLTPCGIARWSSRSFPIAFRVVGSAIARRSLSPMRILSLSLLVLVLVLAAGPYTAVVGAADPPPRPSDTNNQPAAPPQNTTPKPSAPPPAPAPTPAPAPAPSTPAPTPTPAPPPASTTKPPSTPPPSSSPTPPPTTAAPSPPTPPPTPAAVVASTAPTPTELVSPSANTLSSNASSSNMGAVVGIVLACVGLLAIIAFFAYRHFRARREDAQNYDLEYGGPSPALESSSAHDAKMYASFDGPKPNRPTTATTNTPSDDIVVMTKYATPASPKFADTQPQLSPPPFHPHPEDVADFTKSVPTFDQSRGPAAAAASTEFAHSYREGSYAASYAESYAGGTSYGGGGSFMNSFDHGMLGSEPFRDTLTDEEMATPTTKTAAKHAASATTPTNGLAGLEAANNNNDSHWMDAMDEMRDTNDSYAMLEADGSFNSRGSAMRFSTESDIHG